MFIKSQKTQQKQYLVSLSNIILETEGKTIVFRSNTNSHWFMLGEYETNIRAQEIFEDIVLSIQKGATFYQIPD